jgi:hypothetical protein
VRMSVMMCVCVNGLSLVSFLSIERIMVLSLLMFH